MIKNIYILWWEGFIWMNLAEYFWWLSWYNVILLSRKKSIFELPKNLKVSREYTDIYDCNFNLEKESIIIHLARTSTSDLNMFKAKELKLKDYINSFEPLKIICFSSSVLYIEWTNTYKEEKKIFEDVWNSNSLLIRLFNTYWKYQLPKVQWSLVTTIFYNFLTSGITELNNINQSRDFIYAWDIWVIINIYINNNISWIVDLWYESKKFRELINNHIQPIILNTDSIKILWSNNDWIFNIKPKNKIDINYTDINKWLNITYDFIKLNINKYKQWK